MKYVKFSSVVVLLIMVTLWATTWNVVKGDCNFPEMNLAKKIHQFKRANFAFVNQTEVNIDLDDLTGTLICRNLSISGWNRSNFVFKPVRKSATAKRFKIRVRFNAKSLVLNTHYEIVNESSNLATLLQKSLLSPQGLLKANISGLQLSLQLRIAAKREFWGGRTPVRVHRIQQLKVFNVTFELENMTPSTPTDNLSMMGNWSSDSGGSESQQVIANLKHGLQKLLSQLLQGCNYFDLRRILGRSPRNKVLPFPPKPKSQTM